MQGFERMDRQFTDAAALAGHLVPEDSMFAFLAAHRAEVFRDEHYADLFAPPGMGRPRSRRPDGRGDDGDLSWYRDSAYGTGDLRDATGTQTRSGAGQARPPGKASQTPAGAKSAGFEAGPQEGSQFSRLPAGLVWASTTVRSDKRISVSPTDSAATA